MTLPNRNTRGPIAAKIVLLGAIIGCCSISAAGVEESDHFDGRRFFNPDNGTKYWFVSGPSEDFCSSPVYNEKNGLLLVSSAWPQRHLLAIKPDGSGDVTNSHVQWQTREGAYYVPSPVCTDDYLFSTMTNGTVHCIDIKTGNTLWTEKLGKQYSSPVLANGLVYMPNDEGVITVIKPDTTFNPVAKNAIAERMNASPAISNGKIYLRGEKHLFCIGKE